MNERETILIGIGGRGGISTAGAVSRITRCLLSVTWARLSELASAEAMREAIRRVRALVRRNGPMFSSPSIYGRQQQQAAAGGLLNWMSRQVWRPQRRGAWIERAPATVTGERRRRPAAGALQVMIATGLPDVVSFPMGFDMFGLLGLPDVGPGRLG